MVTSLAVARPGLPTSTEKVVILTVNGVGSMNVLEAGAPVKARLCRCLAPPRAGSPLPGGLGFLFLEEAGPGQ
ncbi:hypothetical protein GJAV_G00059830 [Gymnothorax javanicus]|nr:hypothetical protein GJAV_G00059830 [Gymnothorax javanicus]